MYAGGKGVMECISTKYLPERPRVVTKKSAVRAKSDG